MCSIKHAYIVLQKSVPKNGPPTCVARQLGIASSSSHGSLKDVGEGRRVGTGTSAGDVLSRAAVLVNGLYINLSTRLIYKSPGLHKPGICETSLKVCGSWPRSLFPTWGKFMTGSVL